MPSVFLLWHTADRRPDWDAAETAVMEVTPAWVAAHPEWAQVVGMSATVSDPTAFIGDLVQLRLQLVELARAFADVAGRDDVDAHRVGDCWLYTVMGDEEGLIAQTIESLAACGALAAAGFEVAAHNG